MKVVGNKVLVRLSKKPLLFQGGGVIERAPGFQDQERPREGVVIGVGRGFIVPEVGLVPIDDIAVGDRVLFVTRAGQDVLVAGSLRRILSYDDVLAVLEVGETLKGCPTCGGKGVVEGDLVSIPTLPSTLGSAS